MVGDKLPFVRIERPDVVLRPVGIDDQRTGRHQRHRHPVHPVDHLLVDVGVAVDFERSADAGQRVRVVVDVDRVVACSTPDRGVAHDLFHVNRVVTGARVDACCTRDRLFNREGVVMGTQPHIDTVNVVELDAVNAQAKPVDHVGLPGDRVTLPVLVRDHRRAQVTGAGRALFVMHDHRIGTHAPVDGQLAADAGDVLHPGALKPYAGGSTVIGGGVIVVTTAVVVGC